MRLLITIALLATAFAVVLLLSACQSAPRTYCVLAVCLLLLPPEPGASAPQPERTQP